jgi:beta-galactosidase
MAPVAGAPPPGRTTAALDADWRFFKGDPAGAADPALDDTKWARVTLPHSYNAADGDDGGGYYRGPGWYRRAIDLGRLPEGDRVHIQFDGAALASDVYVNGRKIGSHAGGHAAFRFDITGALMRGRNLIAVRVDNSKQAGITPLGGDFTVFGGLYRRVFLIQTAAAHIDLMDHGGPGVYVRATDIAPDKASIEAVVRMRNDGPAARKLALKTTILDQEGASVATATRSITAVAGTVAPVTINLAVANPRLWQGRRDPYLYRAVAEIVDGGSAIDRVEVPLGIRSFTVDAARGFQLNGRPYPLHGVNLFHSGRPGKGLAVTDAEVEADMATVDELGATGVRLAHFQHPRAAYDAADRIGFVLWTEIGINGEIDPGAAFTANAAQQMRELIRQNFNHPSVMFWGIGNEVYSTDPSVARLLETLDRVAQEEDPGRPTIYAHCCQADDDPKALASDLIGFNRYFGWYPDQKGTIGEWAAHFHAAFPKRAFAVSEYGAGASIIHQQDPPATPDPPSAWHPEQAQTLYHEKNWRDLRNRSGLFGTFVWLAFDLASDGRNEGDRAGINDKGLVTYDRATRKDAFYWYKANWSDAPLLYITGRRFTVRRKPAVEVKVYTNGGPVELILNGETIGRKAPEDHIASWADIRLRRGVNRIEVRGAKDGRALSDRVEWCYEPPPGILASDRP